jgi:hypothetical protein
MFQWAINFFFCGVEECIRGVQVLVDVRDVLRQVLADLGELAPRNTDHAELIDLAETAKVEEGEANDTDLSTSPRSEVSAALYVG